MTDHSDLIARLRAHVRDRGGMSRDAETGEIVLPNGAWAMMLAAASALSSQSLSLSEAREEIERLRRERDHWKFGHDAFARQHGEAKAEIERLKGLVAGIRETPQEPAKAGEAWSVERRLEERTEQVAELFNENRRLKGELAESHELIAAMRGTDEEIAAAIERAGFTADTWIVHALDRACEQWEHFANATESAERQRDEALEALRPFAKAGDLFERHAGTDALIYGPAAGSDYNLSSADLLRARKVLENCKPALADATNDPASSDLSSLRKGAEVAVKPLVWNEYETEGEVDRWDAETALGSFYEISTEFDGYSVSNDHVHSDQRFDTPDEAKAFAQSDYETRIRSALVSGSREDGASLLRTIETLPDDFTDDGNCCAGKLKEPRP